MATTNELPTEDLKKYGILQSDESFSKNLRPNDIKQFLQGYLLVADNEKRRFTFQLVDDLSRLEVKVFLRDKDLDVLTNNSRSGITYTDTAEYDPKGNEKGFSKSAFLYDEKDGTVKEYDLIKNSKELTKEIQGRHSQTEQTRYESELVKMAALIQSKISKFPEIGAELTHNLNIVKGEISVMNNFTTGNKLKANGMKTTDKKLDVVDPDLYQDANSDRGRNDENNQRRTPKR